MVEDPSDPGEDYGLVPKSDGGDPLDFSEDEAGPGPTTKSALRRGFLVVTVLAWLVLVALIVIALRS